MDSTVTVSTICNKSWRSTIWRTLPFSWVEIWILCPVRLMHGNKWSVTALSLPLRLSMSLQWCWLLLIAVYIIPLETQVIQGNCIVQWLRVWSHIAWVWIPLAVCINFLSPYVPRIPHPSNRIIFLRCLLQGILGRNCMINKCISEQCLAHRQCWNREFNLF